MILGHDRLIIKTLENQDIEVEVNYSEDPKINGCKVFRMTFNGQVFHVEREELLRLMLTLGDPSAQKKLLPIQVKNIKKVERRLHLTFKAKKDYREGEVIEVRVPWIDEVVTEEEMLSGNLKNRKPKLAL